MKATIELVTARQYSFLPGHTEVRVHLGSGVIYYANFGGEVSEGEGREAFEADRRAKKLARNWSVVK